MLYCFPFADVLLVMDPEQGGRVCGGGGGGCVCVCVCVFGVGASL